MNFVLAPNQRMEPPQGPLIICILDGVGIGFADAADAVHAARTPVLDQLRAEGPSCVLTAHGTAVGLASDQDMGNSEVGHNTLGSGQVCVQGGKLVAAALQSGEFFALSGWQRLLAQVGKGSTLHFLGLLSDGNIHAHIDHLLVMLERAAADGVKSLRVHILLDGRDVPAQSALDYIDRLEEVLARLRAAGVDAQIASGGGRMRITMDRYGADWAMVARGYNTHVHAHAPGFASARAAVEHLRQSHSNLSDQYLPEFVIEQNGAPVGRIVSGDALVCFNFRGDRAIEISRAFNDQEFAFFDRGERPDILYMGMMEYDGDTKIPRHYLLKPPRIERTMGEYLAYNQIRQLAIAETQKFGHVTYFWNGNRSACFDDQLETYIEIPSDPRPFDEQPQMKAGEITDRLLSELRSGRYALARVNYANADMVGHTGHFSATVSAVEVVDRELARLKAAVDELRGILVVTADHGNADEMYFHNEAGEILRDASGAPRIRPSHSLNPVPLCIYDSLRQGRYRLDPTRARGAPSIANVAATCYELLGFVPPEGLEPSLLAP